MDLDSMYQDVILDHYKHPHGKGLRDPYDVEVHHINPSCGDEITLRLVLGDGADPIVQDVSYGGQGCSISQASVSVMYDLVVGQTLSHALIAHEAFLELMHSRGTLEGDEDVLEDAVAFAGVSKYPARVKCALLGWMAFKDAVLQDNQNPEAKDNA